MKNYTILSIQRILEATRIAVPKGHYEWLVCLFLFFLPASEAPKNFLLWTIISSFFLIQNKNGDRIPFGTFEKILISLYVLTLLSAMLSPVRSASTLWDSRDFLSFALLAIAFRHLRWSSNSFLIVLLASLIAGSLFALLRGYLAFREFPILQAVGHINQSAIFLTMVAGILVTCWVHSLDKKCFIGGLALVFIWIVVNTGSRAALAGLGGSLVVSTFMIASRKSESTRRNLRKLFLLATCLTVCVILNPTVIVKQYQHFSDGSIDAPRIALWRSAFDAWKLSPAIGFGPGTFKEVTSESFLLASQEESGTAMYAKERYFHANHAHNFMFQWMVEFGIVGLALFLVWLGYSVTVMIKKIHRISQSADGPHEDIAYLLAWIGLSAISVCVVSGMGTTTFRLEHGLLLAILTGLGCREREASNISVKKP